MPHASKKWLPALLAAMLVLASLLVSAQAEAQGPPPPPPPCPHSYHWDGPRGCWPNHRGVPPLCPPGMAWKHGQCRPMGHGPGMPPPPADQPGTPAPGQETPPPPPSY